eukprot:6528663-Prymnesium_polylepis.1
MRCVQGGTMVCDSERSGACARRGTSGELRYRASSISDEPQRSSAAMAGAPTHRSGSNTSARAARARPTAPVCPVGG